MERLHHEAGNMDHQDPAMKEHCWFAAELRCYNIDTDALSETRLLDKVLLKEAGSVFTFLFGNATLKVDNVSIIFGLAKKNTLPNMLPKLSKTPQASIERLMTVLFPEPKKHFLTVVCCPNLTLRHSV